MFAVSSMRQGSVSESQKQWGEVEPSLDYLLKHMITEIIGVGLWRRAIRKELSVKLLEVYLNIKMIPIT